MPLVPIHERDCAFHIAVASVAYVLEKRLFPYCNAEAGSPLQDRCKAGTVVLRRHSLPYEARLLVLIWVLTRLGRMLCAFSVIDALNHT